MTLRQLLLDAYCLWATGPEDAPMSDKAIAGYCLDLGVRPTAGPGGERAENVLALLDEVERLEKGGESVPAGRGGPLGRIGREGWEPVGQDSMGCQFPEGGA